MSIHNIDEAILKATEVITSYESVMNELARAMHDMSVAILPSLSDVTIKRLRLTSPHLLKVIEPYSKTRKFLGIIKTTKYKRDLHLARKTIRESYLVDASSTLVMGMNAKLLMLKNLDLLLKYKTALLGNQDCEPILSELRSLYENTYFKPN